MFKAFVFLALCPSTCVFGTGSLATDCKRREIFEKSNLAKYQRWLEVTNGARCTSFSGTVGNESESSVGNLRLPRNLCFNRNADRPWGCTLLATKYLKGSSIYVKPSWRKNGLEFWLKAWNPDIYEGFVLSLASLDKIREYRLTLGAEDNEKIHLTYNDNNSGETVLLKKRTFPHLVPTGKWAGYWLRMGEGNIGLGYQGVKAPFFEWTASNENLAFQPAYMNFGTTKEAWMGIGFKCSECLVEETSVNDENKIYPINLWREKNEMTSSLKLNLRGTGSAIVTLMWTPNLNRSISVEIDAYRKNISLLQYLNSKDYRTIAAYNVDGAISSDEWSEYVLSFTKDNLNVFKGGNFLVNWKSPFPLLFYWFSVSAREGTINWSANCPPQDIDGEPRNGGWSDWGPWTCSVTCGKGEGRVERKCDRPPPNIFGEDCKGSSIYEGPCNDFPCGDITPDTYKLVRRHLSTNYKSLEVEAKDRVEIPCNSQMIPLIRKEVNNLNITWLHNGVKSERTRFLVNENFTLVIPRAQDKHNGVYLCTVYQGPKSVPSKIVIEVVSLIVKKRKPTRKVRKGNSIVMKCNGCALSQVYADLTQRWELNGTPWKEYGMGVVEMASTDKLENVDDMHAGIWTCIVTQEDFKFKWTTNWINLKVKTAPNFWSHLVEDVATVPMFAKAGNQRNIMIIFVSLIIVLVWIILLLICILIRVLDKC